MQHLHCTYALKFKLNVHKFSVGGKAHITHIRFPTVDTITTDNVGPLLTTQQMYIFSSGRLKQNKQQ